MNAQWTCLEPLETPNDKKIEIFFVYLHTVQSTDNDFYGEINIICTL